MPATPVVKDTTAKPSARQIYCMTHLMVDLLELEWPADRAAASDLIGALRAQRDAVVNNPAGSLVPDTSSVAPAAVPAGDDIPF